MDLNKLIGDMLIDTRGLIFLMVICLVPDISSAELIDDLAKKAFYEIEKDPFNSRLVKSTVPKLELALKQKPNDPWVLIATSRLIQEIGYRKGGRYRISAYAPGAIDKASHYAKEALANGKDLTMAHSQFAKIQMIQGNLKSAWLTLNTAHELDPKDFYPWYYRAVISIQMKDYARAKSLLNEAELHAEQHYQKSWVVARRISLAKLKGIDSEIDHAYKESIEFDPKNAHRYGNYANYLKKQKRYEEAVHYYKKAIEISSYPLARKGLEEASSLLAKQRGMR